MTFDHTHPLVAMATAGERCRFSFLSHTRKVARARELGTRMVEVHMEGSKEVLHLFQPPRVD